MNKKNETGYNDVMMVKLSRQWLIIQIRNYETEKISSENVCVLQNIGVNPDNMRVFSPEELIEASYTFKICRHDLYWSLNPDVKYDCIICVVPRILIQNMTAFLI